MAALTATFIDQRQLAPGPGPAGLGVPLRSALRAGSGLHRHSGAIRGRRADGTIRAGNPAGDCAEWVSKNNLYIFDDYHPSHTLYLIMKREKKTMKVYMLF